MARSESTPYLAQQLLRMLACGADFAAEHAGYFIHSIGVGQSLDVGFGAAVNDSFADDVMGLRRGRNRR